MSDNNGSDNLLEIQGVSEWLDHLNLSRPKKRIHRDFSDGKLLAEIIVKFYPKLVEMHNYSTRCSFATKMENWKILNRRVLKKLKIHLNEKEMTDICNSTPGVIEKVLIDLRDKIKMDEEKKKQDLEDDKVSSDGSWYDVGAMDDESDVMIIPVRRRCSGDGMEIFKKKVIAYDTYETLKNESAEKLEAIEILKQKVSHLENLLKSRESHIEELLKSISRKTLRNRKNSMSLIDSKPESLVSLLQMDDTPTILDEEIDINNENSEAVTNATMNDLITFIDS